MVVPFPGSPRPTLGVEWEIALVDRKTRDLSNTAAEVFSAVEELAGSETPHITKELLRNTVELVTGIHSTVGEAMSDLDRSLDLLRRAANPLGVDSSARARTRSRNGRLSWSPGRPTTTSSSNARSGGVGKC